MIDSSYTFDEKTTAAEANGLRKKTSILKVLIYHLIKCASPGILESIDNFSSL